MPKIEVPSTTISPAGSPPEGPTQAPNEIVVNDLNIEASAIFEYVSKEFYDLFPNEKALPCSFTEALKATDTTFFTQGRYYFLVDCLFFKDFKLTNSNPEVDRRSYFYNAYFFDEHYKLSNNNNGSLYRDINTEKMSNILVNPSSVLYSRCREAGNNSIEGLSKSYPTKIKFNISIPEGALSPFAYEQTTDLSLLSSTESFRYFFMADIAKTIPETATFVVNSIEQDVSLYYLKDTILNPEKNNGLSTWSGENETEDIPDNWFNDHVAIIIRDEGANATDELLEDRGGYYDVLKYYLENGDLASEDGKTILVKVEKILENGDTQNFFLYPDDTGKLVFFDTQVIPEKEYVYNFKTLNLVTYNNKIAILETPHTSMTIRPMQPPQYRPQVSFYNFKKDKEKIRILMNLNSNEELKKSYKGFSEEENSDFISKWNLFDPQDLRKTWYQYESERPKYQIYKMSEQQYNKVKSYTDIPDNSLLIETTRPEFGSTLSSKSDFIKPFRNYYYVIRSVNSYGYFSNPSPIYKVYKTQDADETFLDVETVGFSTSGDTLYMPEKTMAKLLQIVPSSYQTSLGQDYDQIRNEGGLNSAEQSLVEPLPNIGIVEEKIWNPSTKFKIRLTSRKTGKKIDLNLNFKLTKEN